MAYDTGGGGGRRPRSRGRSGGNTPFGSGSRRSGSGRSGGSSGGSKKSSGGSGKPFFGGPRPSNLWNETFFPRSVIRPPDQGGSPGSVGMGVPRSEWAGGGSGGGSGSGGYGGRRGGGGGGGGSDAAAAAMAAYQAQLAELRRQAEARLTGERDRQFGDINGLRHGAIRQIDTDASNTIRALDMIYGQADREGRQYGNQLAGLGRDIGRGLDAYANPIAADLAAQGVRVTPQGLTAADAQYARALAGAQGTMNTRLQQVNSGARADSKGQAVNTRQAGRATATNEAAGARDDVNNLYMQELLKLQLLGLEG